MTGAQCEHEAEATFFRLASTFHGGGFRWEGGVHRFGRLREEADRPDYHSELRLSVSSEVSDDYRIGVLTLVENGRPAFSTSQEVDAKVESEMHDLFDDLSESLPRFSAADEHD